MNKLFKKIPVYTRDSVAFIKDEKKKQETIDSWTDRLATKMAEMSSDKAIIDEFGIQINRMERRGGHNRKTVEVLNVDGYLTKVFHSVAEAGVFFDRSGEYISRIINDNKKNAIGCGFILRYRETDKERMARKKAYAKRKSQKKKKSKKHIIH